MYSIYILKNKVVEVSDNEYYIVEIDFTSDIGRMCRERDIDKKDVLYNQYTHLNDLDECIMVMDLIHKKLDLNNLYVNDNLYVYDMEIENVIHYCITYRI